MWSRGNRFLKQLPDNVGASSTISGSMSTSSENVWSYICTSCK